MKAGSAVTLIEEQEAAVNAINGVFVVLAGPGSGKTRCLIERYLRMMMSGIPQQDMLNLTFTASAASEMASRAGVIDAKNIFRTFHSFALETLKNERDKLPFETCDTIIPVELQDYQLLFDLVKIWPSLNWRTLQEKITEWKCSAVDPDRAVDESQRNAKEYFYALAYRDYEIKCRQQGWLDFSSLMDEAVKLLETNDEVRRKYKRKYIAVDEAQDCDELQFRMLQLLFDGNIFAVGDENQLIYEWRNARSGNLTNFSRTFPGAKILYLGTNHRSTGSLVNFLKEILPVDNGLASHMTTYNGHGAPIQITQYLDNKQEAEQVLKKITDGPNSAILARTNRQLFFYQRICGMRGIKTVFLGKKDLWDQSEVKKLLGFVKHETGNAVTALNKAILQHNLIDLYSRVGNDNTMEASPVENLNSNVKIAAGKGDVPEFLDYVRRLTYARKSTNTKALTLATVHQAKGREFDYVHLVGVKQGTMPHKDGEFKEEARIFFVACSRAAKELHISFYGPISEFLLNYQDQIVDFNKEQNDAPSVHQYEG